MRRFKETKIYLYGNNSGIVLLKSILTYNKPKRLL